MTAFKVTDLVPVIDAAFTSKVYDLHQGGCDQHWEWDFTPITGNPEHKVIHVQNHRHHRAALIEAVPHHLQAHIARTFVMHELDAITRVIGWLSGAHQPSDSIGSMNE